jgi:phenylalanyl-tRNA synthetase beta chain
MGGARSEVVPQTKRVLMEVATWDGPSIHRASWRLGLRSEASSRFEKGLQPEQCMHAQALAARLMVECCGASIAPGTIDVARPLPPLPQLRLREQRVQAILGVAVPVVRQREILDALDFACATAPDGLEVTVPALRRDDVTREVDLIEEVARIDGLERLPATLPARRGAAGLLTHAQRVRRRAEDAMVGRGLFEVAGWSFAEPALLDRLLLADDDPLRRVVRLENPMSDAQSIMRPTLLGSLLDAARHNVARNGPDVAIFESGTVYRAGDRAGAGSAGRDAPSGADATTATDEHHALGALLSGSLAPRSWHGASPRADFFSAKALLAALLDHLHVDWSVRPEQRAFLHPGRSAAVLVRAPGRGAESDATRLGWIGELHPTVAATWDLDGAATFAIDVGKLAEVAPETIGFRAFGSVPSLRQDIAVTLPDGVAADTVLESVREAAGETLHGVDVFDVYTGAQVGEGRRSLALALTFRAQERTLTDEDVAPVRERIVATLAQLGGELRG